MNPYVTRSPLLEEAQRFLRKQLDLRYHPIAITGSSGSGKEALLRAVARQQILAHNCATLTSEMAESELFGHVRGAFTGAVGANSGLFRAAKGKILFLDELGELPLEAQAKLLRVLEERTVSPVGSREQTYDVSDVVVVIATHRDLAHEVHCGRFREDLFYRLRWGCRVRVPDLKARPEDVRLLVEQRLAVLNEGRAERCRLDRSAWGQLERYSWPGNVRQLHQVVDQLALLESTHVDATVVQRCLQDFEGEAPSSPPHGMPAIGWTAEQRQALSCYRRFGFNMTDSAAHTRMDAELRRNPYLATYANNITPRLQRLYVRPLVDFNLDPERVANALVGDSLGGTPVFRRVRERVHRFITSWRERFVKDPDKAESELRQRIGALPSLDDLGRLCSLLSSPEYNTIETLQLPSPMSSAVRRRRLSPGRRRTGDYRRRPRRSKARRALGDAIIG